MQNGYPCITPKEVARHIGSVLNKLLLAKLPTPQTRTGQWLLTQRSSAAELVRLLEQKLPSTVKTVGLTLLLRHLFAEVAQQGQLDFLLGKRLSIEVPDLKMHYELGLDPQRQFWLEAAGASGRIVSGEVLFRANSTELMSLLSQQVDPDTLFFQRRLTILGDTELGLQLKNYLDTLEPEQFLPPQLVPWLQAIAIEHGSDRHL